MANAGEPGIMSVSAVVKNVTRISTGMTWRSLPPRNRSMDRCNALSVRRGQRRASGRLPRCSGAFGPHHERPSVEISASSSTHASNPCLPLVTVRAANPESDHARRGGSLYIAIRAQMAGRSVQAGTDQALVAHLGSIATRSDRRLTPYLREKFGALADRTI